MAYKTRLDFNFARDYHAMRYNQRPGFTVLL